MRKLSRRELEARGGIPLDISETGISIDTSSDGLTLGNSLGGQEIEVAPGESFLIDTTGEPFGIGGDAGTSGKLDLKDVVVVGILDQGQAGDNVTPRP